MVYKGQHKKRHTIPLSYLPTSIIFCHTPNCHSITQLVSKPPKTLRVGTEYAVLLVLGLEHLLLVTELQERNSAVIILVCTAETKNSDSL